MPCARRRRTSPGWSRPSRPTASPLSRPASPPPTPNSLSCPGSSAHRLRGWTRTPRVPLDQDVRVRRRTRRNRFSLCRPGHPCPSPAQARWWTRDRWALGVENSSRHIRDITFAEDASTVHAGTAPRAMVTFGNLAIGMLKTLGADSIAQSPGQSATNLNEHFPSWASPTIRTAAEPDQALPVRARICVLGGFESCRSHAGNLPSEREVMIP